jgi:hypothetical protein
MPPHRVGSDLASSAPIGSMTEQSGQVGAAGCGGGPAAGLLVGWRPWQRVGVPLAWAVGTFIGFARPSQLVLLDLFRIVLVGLLLLTLYLFSSGYFLPGGASDFTLWAEALAHGTILPPAAAAREVGFPLLLLLSGYTITGSLIGVTLIHAAFALLMPVLVYFTLRPFSPSIGYYSGQIGNLCLGSFLYIKFIHHDQTYIFFMMLMVTMIILFFVRGTYRYLYFFTLASLAASVSRPAGNLLFPLFLVLAFIAGERPRMLRHYVLTALIFASVTAAYQWHRYVVFDGRDQPNTPSYTGQQVFYNLYLNSQEYGIMLGPNIGPNMRRLDEALRVKLSPNPRDSVLIQAMSAAAPRSFTDAQYFPFTTDELMQRIYMLPNWEYYLLLCEARESDQMMLSAAFEIIKKYPIFFLRYSLRNTLIFLFHPGFAHTRFNVYPLTPVGLQFYPELARVDEEHDIAARALREVKLNILEAEPGWLRNRLIRGRDAVGNWWKQLYQPFVEATAALMLVGWLALAGSVACPIERRRRGGLVRGIVALWSSQPALVASLAATSMLLLYNAGVTAAFAEPDYRYHHFVLLLRVLVSGFGAVVILRILPRFPAEIRTSSIPWRDVAELARWCRDALRVLASHDALAMHLTNRPKAAALLLLLLTGLTFGGWTVFMASLTV